MRKNANYGNDTNSESNERIEPSSNNNCHLCDEQTIYECPDCLQIPCFQFASEGGEENMAATATEGALDLSAKPESKNCSPVPSVTSETEVGERSSSVSSEGHETDGSTGTAVKAVAGHMMMSGHVLPPGVSPRRDSGGLSSGSPISPMDTVTSTPSRPFKMYPFDSMPNMNINMYTQMAAAAAASNHMQVAAGLPGMAGTTGLSPFALLDSAISLTSPIGQYLQQRKRRNETRRETHRSGDSMHSPKSNTNGNCSSGGEGDRTPNSKMPKTDSNMVGDMQRGGSRDVAYWERRRKNNEAAKRSRDSRRAKEEEIALRAAFLEQENLKLKAQVAILKNETAKLHYMLYNRV